MRAPRTARWRLFAVVGLLCALGLAVWSWLSGDRGIAMFFLFLAVLDGLAIFAPHLWTRIRDAQLPDEKDVN
jgi:hypothetical protein